MEPIYFIFTKIDGFDAAIGLYESLEKAEAALKLFTEFDIRSSSHENEPGTAVKTKTRTHGTIKVPGLTVRYENVIKHVSINILDEERNVKIDRYIIKDYIR